MTQTLFATGAAYVDGRVMPLAEAAIPLIDYGYRRSDVTYDVVSVWNGAFFRLDDHIARFRASMQALRLDPGETDADIRAILMRLVQLSGLRDAYVGMDCLRGTPKPGLPPHPLNCRNYLAAFARPYIWVMSPEVQARGAHLIVASVPRIPEASIDPTVKNFHWGDLTQALFQAHDRGADTAVLLDTDGLVTEGPGFNIFAITNGIVATPDRGALEGITRRSVIELCDELGMRCEVRPVPVAELHAADELFTCTTAGGIMPVSRLDGRIMGNDRPGPISAALRERYWARRAEGWHATPVDYQQGGGGMMRLGIDVGGTFTDFVAYDSTTRTLRAWKNMSTPADPTEGILVGLAETRSDTLSGLRVGTTVVTNALLEGTGAVVGYVTTRGFRDIPFIGRGNRRHHYDLAWVKPKPLVKRRHAYEVGERIGSDGRVLQPLDEDDVRALAQRMHAEGEIEAVAVMLMHSYIEPAHERRIRDIFAAELPDVPVSISYDVLPKWKEHYRSSTTLCDAFVKPLVRRQLGSLSARLDAAGIVAPVVVMRSNGGEMTLDVAAASPIQMAVSGPTGGVIAAKRIAGLLGIANVVTLDMGGTSTDVSTIVDGQERFTTDFEIEWGRPVQIPMIDIRTIGAGGGSLARVDAGGMLVVGPQSAGARPGPACYGRGGSEPTVTDANVVAGRIAADNFLGGSMRLDAAAAYAAVATLAARVEMGVEQTALAIVRIANNTMVGALHTALTEQGLDPRDFTIMPFGGAGPLHVCDLMEAAAIPRAMVPNFPGQFSAFGFILADARVDRHRTVQLSSRAFDQARAENAMADLVGECRAELLVQGHADDVAILRSVDMRYAGQNYELNVPVNADSFHETGRAALWEAFHTLHAARFGFRLGDAVEIITFIVTATVSTGTVELPIIAERAGDAEPRQRRDVWFDGGWIDTPVYDRASLLHGHKLSGPALVEEAASVTVVGPGWVLVVDAYGNLHIHDAR